MSRLLIWKSIVAATVVVLCGSASVQAATLEIVSLTCQDSEDITGPDEAVLIVDGQTAYGSMTAGCPRIGQGQTMIINRQMPLPAQGQSQVTLLDYDFPDPSDNLGTQAVPFAFGAHTLTFQGRNFSYALQIVVAP